jgi:hypothetical protein
VNASEAAAEKIARQIRQSGLSIYDRLDLHPSLYFDTPLLQVRLRVKLLGQAFAGPIRTRSLLAKGAVADALGYPVLRSFARVRPRFPGQNLDVAVQLSNNYQVWNEEVDSLRRYAFLRPDVDGRVVAVRVVTGEVIAALDRTGTLTSKYQASRKEGRSGSVLVTPRDTLNLIPLLGAPRNMVFTPADSVAHLPRTGMVLPISDVYGRLLALVGTHVPDPGVGQDRVRGEGLQRAVTAALRVGRYENVGQWPDIRSQVLEVKLQMARTIDLGLVLPSSTEPAAFLGAGMRHSDVRYAVVYGTSTGEGTVLLDEVVVTTGEAFFEQFRQFGGLKINRKLQIPLPDKFFDAE